MVKDKNKTAENYMINALKIQEFLKNGENVVFISLGDISVYSTFGCLQPIVAENGYKTVMIPGVPSFCAVSSALGISRTEKNKPIHIIPAVYGGIESYMELAGTKVFMKSSGKLEEIKKESKNRGLLDKSFAVADCGLETEKIIRQFDTAEDNTGYFTTVIVKE